MQLDLTLGSMSDVTAGCVYHTLLSGVQFVIDYFKYIGQEELLNRISMGQLADKLVEGFFGIVTQRNQGNNLRIADMARRFSNCAFTYLGSYVATGDKCGVSVDTLRPAADETYMYSQDTWEDDQGILWKFQQIDLFNVRDLRNFRKY